MRESGSGSKKGCGLDTRAQRDLRRAEAGSTDWDDDRIYEKARLMNAAVMAKIHTVEWMAAILPPDHRAAMRATGTGSPARGVRRRAAASADGTSERIPGSPRTTDGAPHADRGVRRRPPDAPADPRRIPDPVARRRPASGTDDSARPGGPTLQAATRSEASERRVLRRRPPRRPPCCTTTLRR